MLSIKDLSVAFKTRKGEVNAVRGISLDVAKGKTLGIVGESGSGKSVTSYALMRILDAGGEIRTGDVVYGGTDLRAASEKDMRDIRGREISMIFQNPRAALNPIRRVGHQVEDVLIRHAQATRQDAKAKAIAALEAVKINDAAARYDAYPFELSGGMRQRVMIALAFSCDPQLLIADEPTTALDVTVQRQVLLLLREKARERGTAILLITHDMALVSQFCDRVYVMYTGAVVEQGITAQVMADPRHPYTQGLLSGLPEQVEPGQALLTIPGQVPNLSALPEGCTFRDRCAFAMAQCVQRPPMQTLDAEADRKSACWLSAPSHQPVQESLS